MREVKTYFEKREREIINFKRKGVRNEGYTTPFLIFPKTKQGFYFYKDCLPSKN